jgi:predicted nucleic acid-binding protein
MNTWVIDASVVAAAMFHEAQREPAQAVLVSDATLLAPDLILTELANVIWKRHGRGEINDAEAQELLADIRRLPLRLVPTPQLVTPALAMAVQSKRTVYDCTYLALAVEQDAVMLTGDKRLVNSLQRTPLQALVRWIGELSV